MTQRGQPNINPNVGPDPDKTRENPDISIKEYRNLKRKLKELEQKNCQKIIAIPCSGDQGWYEIAEHSALIYYYEVCQKLDAKNKFLADTRSYYDQYEIGYMRSKGVDVIRERIKQAGLYLSEAETNHIYTFNLNAKFSHQKLAALKKREHSRRLDNLTPIQANNLDPELHHLLTTSSARLHRICGSRLDKLSSQVNGARIVVLIDNLLIQYHQTTMLSKHHRKRIQSQLESMRHDIYSLIFEVKILGEAKLWNLELCASVSETLYEIRNRVESHLKKVISKGEF